MTHTLVVATKNEGKLAELRELFEGLDVRLVAMTDVIKRDFPIVEDASTFEGNAKIKAFAVARATGMLTLADDSGLEVDVLGGAPGVRSARYAGERATDAENNAALLAALEAVSTDPSGNRLPGSTFPARFRCALVLVDPFAGGGEPFVVDGTCEGRVTLTPRGSGGFGYDPLFLVGDTERTMAELDEGEKNRLSHRGRAASKLRLVLEKVLASRDANVARIVG